MGIYDLVKILPSGGTVEEGQRFQEALKRRLSVLQQKREVDLFFSECTERFFLDYEKSGNTKPDNALIEELTVFIRREFKRRRLMV